MHHKKYIFNQSLLLIIFIIFFSCFVFLQKSFVLEKNNTREIKILSKTEEKKETLSGREPIHIGNGFKEQEKIEKPTRIIIPRLNISIPIVEASVIDGAWEVSNTFANHGIGSSYPGEKGNMVIFAHAREHLFLPLQQIAQNDEVYVLTKQKWYAYKVSAITQVTPDNVTVIAPTDAEQVTLFTCSGFADEKRLIVVGKPV